MTPQHAYGLGSPCVEAVDVSTYVIPTDAPESDGTLEWHATTLVLVRIKAAAVEGIGYSYADHATAVLIHDKLAPLLHGREAMDNNARWCEMAKAIRNVGRPGIAGMAIAAVDNALWDLKAKLLGVSLAELLGMARTAIPVYGSGGFTSYGSGGFTSYDVERLQSQFGGWAQQGIRRMKMKVGRAPQDDVARVQAVREAIGDQVELFVDANGAYTRKCALQFAERYAELGVRWFEEPVSSDDLDGLRLMRDRAPAGMAISAGEYGYEIAYFRRMLEAQAVDVLQADATRCGITGFLAAANLAEAFGLPLSSHCAPALHLALCCAARQAVHLEYFYDHVRIEQLLFDGAVEPVDGLLAPHRDRMGLGIVFKERDAAAYARH